MLIRNIEKKDQYKTLDPDPQKVFANPQDRNTGLESSLGKWVPVPT
jgi:hypothetical protein